MQTQLPGMLSETLNFVRQVELNRTIEGVYPVSKLVRLSETLASDEGLVTVKLEFGDCVGFACLKGKVSATLVAECQRCLDPVETAVSGEFKFALIHSEEEMELLPEELEPYLVEGEEQSVIDLVEDELLLSLPMVSVHEKACSDFMSKQNKAAQAAIQADRDAEREASNPFAALKSMQGQSKKGDKFN
ncbi:MAG TPA: hypothetical protein ENJ87_04430 [Gammaproteobacteria bacterium]|nr:hypothetical protein [Gammaproteobacteria bacterium]